MALTKKKLVEELENSNKSLREVAEKYETNKSHVFSLKEKTGLKALKHVVDSGREKRLNIAEVLDELSVENPNYWSYEVSGSNSLELKFYEFKWQRSEDLSKQNVQGE